MSVRSYLKNILSVLLLSFLASAANAQTVDLTVTMTGPASVQNGSSAIFDLTIVNGGPSDADGATFSHAVPSGFAITEATCFNPSNGGVCPTPIVSGQTVSGTIPTLPNAGSVVIRIATRSPVRPTASSFTSTATVSAPTGREETNEATNTAVVNTAVSSTQPADLAATATAAQSSYNFGDLQSFTFDFVNNGPGPADGARITARHTTARTGGVTGASYSDLTINCVASGGAICPNLNPAASGNFGSTGNYFSNASVPTWPSGGALAFTVSYKINDFVGPSSGCGSTNRRYDITVAGITSIGSPLTDSVSGNNSSTTTHVTGPSLTQEVCEAPPPAPRTDLSATLSIDNADLTFGSPTTYTVVHTNLGPSDADGSRIGLSSYARVRAGNVNHMNFDNARIVSCTAAGGAVCPAISATQSSFLYSSWRSLYSATVATWPSGGSLTVVYEMTPKDYTLSANCGPDPVSYANLNTQAFSTVASGNVDTVSNNNTQTLNPINGPQQVLPDCPNADIAVTNTIDAPDLVFGSPITYTTVWTNNGPDMASGARITGNLLRSGHRGGVTGINYSDLRILDCTATGGVDCPTPVFSSTGVADSSNAIFTAPIGDWPSGASISLTYSVTPNSYQASSCTGVARSAMINVGRVVLPTGLTDPVSNNNAASVTTNAGPLCMDMLVTASLAPAAPYPDGPVTLTIEQVVPANGTTATDWTLQNVLPAGFVFDGTSANCSVVTGTATCGTFSWNASTREFSSVTPTAAPGSVLRWTIAGNAIGYSSTWTNTVDLVSPSTYVDPVLTSNSATVNMNITGTDPKLTKQAVDRQIIAGDLVTYRLTVSNPSNGNQLSDFDIVDQLPTGWLYDSTTTISMTGGTTRANGVDPSSGDSNPRWTGFTVPPGGTIFVEFEARSPSSLSCGTTNYNNSATISYMTSAGADTRTYDGALIGNDNDNVSVPCSPQLTKSFNTPTITSGDNAELTFRISPVTPGIAYPFAMNFSDTLPSSLQIVGLKSGSNSCGGSITDLDGNSIGAGDTGVKLTGGLLQNNGTQACSFTVLVTNKPRMSNTECTSAPVNFTNGASNISDLVNLSNAVTNQCLRVLPTTGTLRITKALSLPSDITGPFTFGFSAVCDLPSADTVYGPVSLTDFPTTRTVDITGIPEGANCSVQVTTPTPPSGYVWGTPSVGAMTPSTGIPANAVQTVTVTNTLSVPIPFTSWPNPAQVCTGAINHANYVGQADYFGSFSEEPTLSGIYDDPSRSFVSAFVEVNGRPGYKATARVPIGAATALPTSTGSFYQPGTDVTGQEVAVYSFRVEAPANQTVAVPYGDLGSNENMLVTVEGSDGSVLASQFLSGWDNSGSLSVQMPSDGVAFQRYYVIDLGGAYGSVLDGGCAIADQAGPVISGPSGEPGDANSAVSILENATAVTQLSATDDNTFEWSVAADASGYDNDLFTIDANGNLAFKVAPDFETPADQGIPSSSNTYLVRVVATDSFGNVSTQDVTVTVTDVDEVPPSIEQTDGVNEPVGGPTAEVSIPEGQRLITTYSANEAVQWSISGGADADAFEISSEGVLRFRAQDGADFEAPTDLGDGAGNNTYVVVVTARDAAGNTSLQTLTVTVTDLWDSLPGTVPLYSADLDGDGIADSLESATADRDGDGRADAEDYDPQGYLYCEDDGRILAGGSISVTGPAGSNNAVGTLNNIRIVKDGSDGQYQWFATAPGTYTMAVTYPTSVGVPSTTRVSSGTLDVTDLLPNNPASIGSSEFGTSAFLSNYWDGGRDPNVAANTTTAFYTTFEIEAGDPNVIGNNVPVAQCGVNKVSIARVSDGAEANGETTSPLVYRVSQTRVSTQDTVVAYRVAGASQATEGVDFAAVSGVATIAAGQTSTQITVAVLEDGLIEGDEAVVLELTGITAGDLTTVVTDVAGGLSASAVIVDDDFADVVINEIDLTTTEGREADPALVGLSLAGQPTAPVVMSITVDAQCTVSPSTLTFTADNYAAEQRLTIRAVNDELVEGAHSCRPIVSISSTDLRYHGFAVTMPQITIADDLVDQVRTPLKSILQSDFTNTVSAQSQAMSGISRGALGRLHEGTDKEECQTVTPMAFDGTTKANEDGANSAWSFDQDNFDCVTGVRTITDGSFTLSKSDGSDEQGLFSMTVQKETQQGSSALSGVFAGGYVSRTALTGIGTGAVDGVGVMGGIYGARSMQNGLVVDYYAGGSAGTHRYDLSFYAPSAAIRADGKYSYSGAFAGAALSGEVTHEQMQIRPRLGFDIGRATASDASVSARQLGQTDTGRIKLDAVEGARGYAEAVFSFGSQAGDESAEDAPRAIRKFEFAPRVFCEQAFGKADTACGGGASIRFTNTNPVTGSDLDVTFDLEGTGDVQRSRIGLSYTEQILGGAGSVVSTLGTDATGNAQIGQSVEIKF